MKQFIPILILVLFICGCSSPTVFEEKGFKIKFPCNYEKKTDHISFPKDTVYGCGKNGGYIAVIYEGSLEQIKKNLQSRAEHITKDSPDTITEVKEEKIHGFSSLIATDRYTKDSNLVEISKQIFVSKGNLIFHVASSMHKEKSKEREDFPPEVKDEFEKFFSSIEVK